jgi:CRISPR/Cas system CMR subunit Cmr6 (Cas7 group RAMP superfamily)
VGGNAVWAELAHDLLVEAVRTWGVGGKTSAGYGRGPKVVDRMKQKLMA